METSFVEWINRLMHAHPLMAGVVVEFSTWGVPLFGILADRPVAALTAR